MAKRSGRSSRGRRRPAASTRPSPDAVRYVESSALVAALLAHDADALRSLQARVRLITSALTVAEAARAIVRARVTGRLTPEAERAAVRALRRFERRCYVVGLTEDILARVGRPFPVEPVRTLDAVHIASAQLALSCASGPMLVRSTT